MGFLKHQLKWAGVAAFSIAVLSGCGSDSNVNQIWGTKDNASDTLLAEARAAYDRGDFDRAEELAKTAYNRNKSNEKAAIQLGYIYLSQGGVDPFNLARELIAIQKQDEEGSSGANLVQDSKDDCVDLDNSDDSGEGSTDVSKTLSALSCRIFDLSKKQINSLREKPFEGESQLFEKYPILVPKPVTDDLRKGVTALKYMDKAVDTVCAFVDNSVKVDNEERHHASGCAQVDGRREKSAQAHFLWAFSHLSETLIYQTVLLYSSTDKATSNFEAASNDIDNFEGKFEEFIPQVRDMKNAIDSVFDTSDPKSMIASTLRNLDAVNRSFSALAGIPESVTKKISDAMAEIEKLGNQVGGDAGNTKALKAKMTEKFAEVVGEKIDEAAEKKLKKVNEQYGTNYKSFEDIENDNTLPEDQKKEVTEGKEDLCTSYDELAEGSSSSDENQPEVCK